MGVGHFLGGVGAVIWNPADNRYLILRRSGQRDFQQGAWECVAGRVDQGENYEQALYREVQEEIGAEIQIEFIIGTTHFFRGEEKPENELLGVLYGCTLKNPEAIQRSDEHSEWRWASLEEIERILPPGHWLRLTIHTAELLRKHLPPQLKEHFRRHGFEIFQS